MTNNDMKMMKPIKDFEGYFITEDGKVGSEKRKKFLTPRGDGKGYFTVRLYKDGMSVERKIHRLVAETFIPNPNNLPYVNHKDENKHNNCASNLEWCTARYNCNYGTRTKRQAEKISKKINQYDLNGNFIKTWDSLSAVKSTFNTSINSIGQCCNGKSKQSNGYKGEYSK